MRMLCSEPLEHCARIFRASKVRERSDEQRVALFGEDSAGEACGVKVERSQRGSGLVADDCVACAIEQAALLTE